MKSSFGPCPHRNVGGFHLSRDEYSKQHLILQHMMSHYRRLYTAKCDVDTSTPSCFKPRYKPKSRPPLPTPLLPSQNHLTRDDIRFLESLAGDIRSWWTGKDLRHPVQHSEPKANLEHDVTSTRNKIPCPITEKCNVHQEWCLYEQQVSEGSVEGVSALTVSTVPKSIQESNSKRCGLVCKPTVTSRLREMSVYHPPRRKYGVKESQKILSRSSKNNKGSSVCRPGNYLGTCRLFASEIDSVIEQQKEELMYLQFVQDITQEILTNDIYSNEGVNRIFAKHIYLNKGKLNMGKMIQETETLRKQIGIPGSKCSLFCQGQRRLSSPNVMKEITKIIDHDAFEDSSQNDQKKKLSFTQCQKVYHSRANLSKSCENIEEKQFNLECNVSEKSKKNNVLDLLQDMGFDNKMAEEICLCMSEKDITKFHFAQNDSVSNDYWQPDLSKTNHVSKYERKEVQGRSKCVVDLYSDFVFEKSNAEKTGLFPSEKETVQGERTSDSLHGSDTTEDFGEFIQTMTSGDGCAGKESGETASSSEAESGSDSDPVENKRNFSPEKIEVNLPVGSSMVTSPVGSDYSSMKEQNESVCEDSSNAEEADEGRESGSDIEEDIPEELSQSSSSSGISQLTEQLKKCSVNVNTVLHSRSNDRRNIIAQCNSVPLKQLIL